MIFYKAFLLSVLVAMCIAEECSTPLFRDVVAADQTKTRYTLDNIGETDPNFITGLPLINSSDPITIRSHDFTTPTLLLAERDNFSPHYWLLAIDLQQGPAGVNCFSSGVVEEMSLEFKKPSWYSPLDTPYREGIDPANSNPTLNLKKLGGLSGGRVVRLRWQPIDADGIRIKVLSIDPLDSTIPTESCLRVEVYGCDKTDRTAPPVYPTPLLQYNLPEPSADAYHHLYTDPSYSGILSGGFGSGGTGILTDGTVGRNAVEDPKDWLGWKRGVTSEIEVVFLFTTKQEVNKVNIYFWEDSIVGMGGVELTDHNNNTIHFDRREVSTITNNINLLTYTMDTEVRVSYVRFVVSYATDRNVVLLTEIEMARGLSNLVTGRNVSQVDFTRYTLPTYNTTRVPGMSTNTTTNSMAYNTTTTTTELATVPTTNIPTNITSISNTTTTATTATRTPPPPPSTSTSSYMPMTSQHTNTSLLCCDVSTVSLAALSSCLLLSLCVNIALLLLLLLCCWRCLSRRGSLIIQGRDYPQDEGVYLPMEPLPLPSYHNVLDKDTNQQQQQQQQTPGTPDNHYYCRLDELTEKASPADARKYYQFNNQSAD